MPFHDELLPHVERELDASRAARARGDQFAEWSSLERAHVLSQPSARLHLRVHLSMLAAAVRQRDVREIVGQLVRAAVAPIGSALGRFPGGNTGRARVPIALPMPVPPDLGAVFDAHGIRVEGATVAGRGR